MSSTDDRLHLSRRSLLRAAGAAGAVIAASGLVSLATQTAASATDNGFRWCMKCQGLVHSSGADCAGNTGGHVVGGTVYVVKAIADGGQGQAGWYVCAACQLMANYPGEPNRIVCMGTGNSHVIGEQTQTQYRVEYSGHVDSGGLTQQDNWHWCMDCSVLYFNGNPGNHCFVTGASHSGGGTDYILRHS